MPRLIGKIVEGLIASGHKTLDDQARALGLPRSTTWTMVASRHKLGRLSQKVRARMLANPDLPQNIRELLESDKATAICNQENLDFPKACREENRFVLTSLKSRA